MRETADKTKADFPNSSSTLTQRKQRASMP